MPSLKDLRNRINSVKSTRKITSAMKMVAASKLRRAQEQAEASKPYADRMARMLASLSANLGAGVEGPKLLSGSGSEEVHLLLVVTADRGLCGAFNSSVIREARRQYDALVRQGKTVKIITVGRKARDIMRRTHGQHFVESYTDLGRPVMTFADADTITHRILAMYEAGEFDVCTMVMNEFKSVISQVTTTKQIVPFALPETSEEETAADGLKALYTFEPDEEQILADLLPRNLSIQIFSALLESAAGEQAARMTAMDNATRNAGDMIDKLTITYNRTRQAAITKELIEIISGAEAV